MDLMKLITSLAGPLIQAFMSGKDPISSITNALSPHSNDPKVKQAINTLNSKSDLKLVYENLAKEKGVDPRQYYADTLNFLNKNKGLVTR